MGRKLEREFFDRRVDEVARSLIGCALFTRIDGKRTGGRIVETEAYHQDDAAAHCHKDAWKVRRDGAAPMFLPGGHAYLYPARVNARNGRWCFNISTGKEGVGSAVLIRALEPTEGKEEMRSRRRAIKDAVRLQHPISYIKFLCAGPGCVGSALGLGEMHNRLSILSAPFEMYDHERRPTIYFGPRVGVKAAKDTCWRYVDEDSCFKSYSNLPRSPLVCP